MSTSTGTSTAAPPWVAVFKNLVVGKEKDPYFNTYAMATLSPEGHPKVRHVIHRAITPTSHILVTTTDTRMQKPKHINSHPQVELAWWIEPTAHQFRITGEAYIIPPPNSSGNINIQEALDKLQAQGEESSPEWWEKERLKHWKENMSGHLRASFGRPTPGTSLNEVSPSEEWPTTLEADSDDPKKKEMIEYAKSHFALVCIRVDGFEALNLKATPNTRVQWTRQANGQWKEVHVAP